MSDDVAKLIAWWCECLTDEDAEFTFPGGFTDNDWSDLFIDSERDRWRQRASDLLALIERQR
jgi:hypothetical protein